MEEECEDEIQLSCATSTLNNKYNDNNNKYNDNNNKYNNNYGRNNVGYNQTAGEACKAGEKEVCTEVTDFFKIVFICVFVYMCICIFVYLCICVFVYLCVCVFMYLVYLERGR